MVTISRQSKRLSFVLSGYFAALGAAVLGGLLPTLSKPLLVQINPLFFTAIVTLSPLMIFTPLSLPRRRRRVQNEYYSQKFGRWGYVILGAISVTGGVVAPYLYFTGLLHTAASDAALLSNGEMIFTILIASLFFGERLSRMGFLAVSLLVLGVAVVVTGLNFSASFLDVTAPGHLLILTATLLWGLDNNVTSIIAETLGVARIAQIRYTIAGLGLLTVAFLAGDVSFANPQILLYVLLLGLFVFSGSGILSIQTLKRLGAITTTIVFPMASVSGLIFAFLLLGEQITIAQVASVAIIIFGIYLLTRRGSVIRQGIPLEQI